MTMPTRQQLEDPPPANIPGVIVWLVQHFGPWIIPTALMCFTSWQLWNKYESGNDKLVEMLLSNIKASGETSKAMSEMTKTLTAHGEEGKQHLEAMNKAVDSLHDDIVGVQKAVNENGTTARENNNVLHEL